MKNKEEFDKIYEKILSEHADDIEYARKEAEKEEKRNTHIFIAKLITSLIVLFVGCLITPWTGIIFTIGVPLLIILKAKPIRDIKRHEGKAKDKYTKLFNKKVISTLINSINKNLTLDCENRDFTRYI